MDLDKFRTRRESRKAHEVRDQQELRETLTETGSLERLLYVGAQQIINTRGVGAFLAALQASQRVHRPEEADSIAAVKPGMHGLLMQIEPHGKRRLELYGHMEQDITREKGRLDETDAERKEWATKERLQVRPMDAAGRANTLNASLVFIDACRTVETVKGKLRSFLPGGDEDALTLESSVIDLNYLSRMDLDQLRAQLNACGGDLVKVIALRKNDLAQKEDTFFRKYGHRFE